MALRMVLKDSITLPKTGGCRGTRENIRTLRGGRVRREASVREVREDEGSENCMGDGVDQRGRPPLGMEVEAAADLLSEMELEDTLILEEG